MIKLFFAALLGLIIYPISLITRRNKRKWCFGGTENSKYLFLLEDFKSISVQAIWYSNDKKEIRRFRKLGYKAYTKLSFIGLYHMLTSKVYFVTHGIGDVNRWTCGNVKIVNLWHGIPYKKIQLDDKKHKKHWLKSILTPTSVRPFDLQVSTSPFVEEILKRSFNVRDNNYVEAMLPRNMILLKPTDEVKNFLIRFEEDHVISIINKMDSFSKSYIYMPTFRDSKRDFIQEAGFDFGKLQKVLESNNTLLLIKLHPFSNSELLKNAYNYKNIHIIRNDIDVYPLLPFTSGLITDYSSIYFDYILMDDKRVIFYVFDETEYRAKDRDVNFDSSYMVGEYCYNFEELLDLLRCKDHSVSMGESKELFWGKNLDTESILSATLKLL